MTPTPDPTPAPVVSTGYIVTFAPGTSASTQSSILAAAGADVSDSIPALRLAFISVATGSTAVFALRADGNVSSVELDRVRTAEAAPSDTEYPNQWSLPKIGWDQVNATTPARSAVVALLDTGVDAGQADLAGQLVAGTSILDGSAGTTDPNGHGTAMAGIIAARTDNGQGIAGVGYGGVKVMPVTVLASDGTGSDSDIIEGVVYAVDHGADVINMSFSNPGFSSALQAAIDYAWAHDVVVVAATGNDSSTTATFPAGDRGVIGVSNTDQADALNPSSNYGADTFLGAPGTDIVSLAVGGGTTSVTGTSASSAEVAAAAALLRAVDPAASNGVIVGRLARNADAAGTAAQTGNGRLNLARAIGDTGTAAVTPAGAAPVGSGGPLVGPYVVAANNDANIAPGWAPTNTTMTFSTLYRKTTGGTVQHVRITLPVGYTNISVAAAAFSSGTWSTPVVNQVARTIDVQLTGGTGLATNNVSWSRIDVTATTPAANQNGNAAEWLMETFTDTAGTTGQQNDNPPVLIGDITNPSATITFVDAGGNAIGTPALQNGVAATLRVRITAVGNGIKYTDVAVPTCFSSPTAVTATVSAGGNAYDTPIVVTDGFIRLPGGAIADGGTLTVQFTTTPNCVSGTYLVSSDPSTNASNPPSGTNQSVSTTGGSLTIAGGLADLSITKTDSPDPVVINGALTYTIGVSNAGPDDASAVKVVDTIPAGTTFVSATGTNWTCNNVSGTVTCNRTGGNLAPGAAPNITIVVTVASTPGSITNSATVSSPNDNTPANNTATAATTVEGPDVSITKTDSPDPVAINGTLTYTITATNNSATIPAVNVVVTDTIPAGTTFVSRTAAGWTCSGTTTTSCSMATLAANTSAIITIVVTAPGTAQTLSNTATVASPSDNTPANNTATASTAVQVADLTITKTDSPDPVAVSGALTYTITVTNSSTVAANSVSVSDTIPAGTTFVSASGTGWTCNAASPVTCTRPSLAAASSATFDIVVTAPATPTTLTNTATVTSPSDSVAGNNSATATTTVSTDNAVISGSVINDLDGNDAQNGSETGLAGADVKLFRDTNANGTFEAGTDLQVGATQTTSATGTFSFTTLVAGTYFVTETNPAGFVSTAAIAGTNGATVVDSDQIKVVLAAGATSSANTFLDQQRADLSITKDDGASAVNAGGSTTYTIRVTNSGPSSVTGAILKDTAAAGLSKTTVACSATPGQCTVGTTPTSSQLESAGGFSLPALASGQFFEITLTANVTATSGS
ncbi:MAG: S8 family serine peptidase, partial [Chloroflexota bacterium]